MKKLYVLFCLVGLALLFSPGCKKKEPNVNVGTGSGSASGSGVGVGTGTGSVVSVKKYICPMKKEHPKLYDKPGKCDQCNMDLIEEGPEEHKDHK